MNIDLKPIRDFEQGISDLLDVLDQLKRLPRPKEGDAQDGARWHRDFHAIFRHFRADAEPKLLERFAEELERALAIASRGAATGEEAEPFQASESQGMLEKPDPFFWGETVTDETGGKYTFKEKRRANATTWADETVDARTGDCYEANDVAGIAVGTIIKIREEYDTGGTLRYVFGGVSAEGETGVAEAVVIRFAIWNNATVVLSTSDWRARPIEYSAYYLDSEHELADANPAAWTNLLANSPLNWFIGADPQNGEEYDIFDVALVGAASARMYIDDADGGKLKFECYGFAGPLHLNMVLVVKGFTRKTGEDAVQVGEPE